MLVARIRMLSGGEKDIERADEGIEMSGDGAGGGGQNKTKQSDRVTS